MTEKSDDYGNADESEWQEVNQALKNEWFEEWKYLEQKIFNETMAEVFAKDASYYRYLINCVLLGMLLVFFFIDNPGMERAALFIPFEMLILGKLIADLDGFRRHRKLFLRVSSEERERFWTEKLGRILSAEELDDYSEDSFENEPQKKDL